jgi:WhiB family transcriptional regulator, redox-sensing transcriptional regulator
MDVRVVSDSVAFPSMTSTWSEPNVDWPERPAWMARGNCVGANIDIFFPERGEDAWMAKEICDGCPVVDECLAYAFDQGEHHGIWGGTTERQRRRMRRARFA